MMIYVECKPDEALIMALGITKGRIEHEDDKPEVIKRIIKNRNAKGMVDEDPSSDQPSYMWRLKQIDVEHDIKLLKYDKTKSRLAILCPRLEEWILKTAREVKIDPSKYGLPTNAKELKKAINQRIDEFKRFVGAISIKGSKRLKRLQKFLEV